MGLPSTLRTSTVIKNAGPKKIFPIFPHVAAILAKWSAIGAAIRCMRIHRTTAAYLMKPHSVRYGIKDQYFGYLQ
jgi:hypothetical protein